MVQQVELDSNLANIKVILVIVI